VSSVALLLAVSIVAYVAPPDGPTAAAAVEARIAEVEGDGDTGRLAALVVGDGVSSSELMVPCDVLPHTRFRDHTDSVDAVLSRNAVALNRPRG